ncbi:hypothetical protein BDZ88DRAFT_417178 [Geranomyces variabilis]|nr:hypothetical protein BDZ88DRAFT_417178 [Geranomyces variabilis]KAJ3135287.1 hypothetical protein HDU90_004010 [Geranomyces variabilis]
MSPVFLPCFPRRVSVVHKPGLPHSSNDVPLSVKSQPQALDIKTPSALPHQVSGEVKDDRDLEKLPSLSNACIGTEDELGRLTQYGENFQKLKGVLESPFFKKEVGNLSEALDVLASLHPAIGCILAVVKQMGALAVNELQTIRAVIDLYGLMTETLDDILSYKTKHGASIAALEPSDDVRKAVTEMNAFGKQFCSEVQNMFPSSHKEHLVAVVKAKWLRKDRKAWAEGKLEEFKALLKKFKLRTLTLIYLTTESMHGKLETVGDYAQNASFYAEKNHKILNHIKAVLPSVSPEEMAIVTIRSRMTQQSKDTDANVIAECRAHEPHARDNPFNGKTIFQIVDLDRRGVLWWAAYYGLPRTFEYVLHHTTIEDLNSQSYEDTPSKSIPGLMIEHPALQFSMSYICKKNRFLEFKEWMRSQPKTMAYVFEELQRKLILSMALPTHERRGKLGLLFRLLYCIHSVTDHFLSKDQGVATELLKIFESRSFELFGSDQPLPAETLEQGRAVVRGINILCKAAHSSKLAVRLPVALVADLFPLHTKGTHDIEPYSVFHEQASKVSGLKLDILIADTDAGAGLAADCSNAIASLDDVLKNGTLTELRLKACGAKMQLGPKYEQGLPAPTALFDHLVNNKNFKTLTLEIEDSNETWDFFDLGTTTFESLSQLKKLDNLKRLRVEVHHMSQRRLEVLADLLTEPRIEHVAIVCKRKYELHNVDNGVKVLIGALKANEVVKYLRMDGFTMDPETKFAIVTAFLHRHRHEKPRYHDMFHLQFDGETPLSFFFANIEEFAATSPQIAAYKKLVSCSREDDRETGEFSLNGGRNGDLPLWKSRLFTLWSRRHYETDCGVCQFYCVGEFDGMRHTGHGDVDPLEVARKHSWKGVKDPFDDTWFTNSQGSTDFICYICNERNERRTR